KEGHVLVHTLADGFPLDLLSVNQNPPGQGGALQKIRRRDGSRYLDVAWPVFGGQTGVLRLGLSLEPYEKKVRAMWLEMSLMTLAVLMVALLGSLLLIRWITRPLSLLTRTVEAVDGGRMDTRVDVKGYFEVESLSHSFNSMLDRIKDHTRQLHAQREEVQRAYAQTQTCLAISQEMGALTTLDEVGAYLIGRLKRVVTCSQIALLVPSFHQEAVFVVTQKEIKKLQGPKAEAAAGLFADSTEPSFIPRSSVDDGFVPDTFKDWENLAVFPVADRGTVIAALCVACPGTCRCARRDLSIIQTVVSQSVGAIRRSITFEEEYRDARGRTEQDRTFSGMVGRDPRMRLIFELIDDIAPTDASVLIQGESGTGKELVAMAIHERSLRSDKPFVVINCSAYPETLLESELFGHEKGAFTGAVRQKPGRFEQADGGTVFLDEIGEISPSAQAKLLRVLQTRQFERIGGEKRITVDVRVVAATNRELLREVEKGNFREDLYYRLNVIPITMPPLRERRNEIPLLARHFLKIFAEEQGKGLEDFAPDALRLLLEYSWPGNVRELENTIEHAAVLAKGTTVEASDLPGVIHASCPEQQAETVQTIQTSERQLLMDALKSCNGNKAQSARRLGISRSTLYAKLKRYGLD
ncbi:MAG: sigma 54-interacting transcriptional regulator, partial [Desulfohalobiaceae bacterium]